MTYRITGTGIILNQLLPVQGFQLTVSDFTAQPVFSEFKKLCVDTLIRKNLWSFVFRG
jgi:hypothetical protein